MTQKATESFRVRKGIREISWRIVRLFHLWKMQNKSQIKSAFRCGVLSIKESETIILNSLKKLDDKNYLIKDTKHMSIYSEWLYKVWEQAKLTYDAKNQNSGWFRGKGLLIGRSIREHIRILETCYVLSIWQLHGYIQMKSTSFTQVSFTP